MITRAVDAKVLHVGGVGLMDAMDKGQNAVVMKAAKAGGVITTVDVFAGSPKDLPAVALIDAPARPGDAQGETGEFDRAHGPLS